MERERKREREREREREKWKSMKSHKAIPPWIVSAFIFKWKSSRGQRSFVGITAQQSHRNLNTKTQQRPGEEWTPKQWNSMTLDPSSRFISQSLCAIFLFVCIFSFSLFAFQFRQSTMSSSSSSSSSTSQSVTIVLAGDLLPSWCKILHAKVQNGGFL